MLWCSIAVFHSNLLVTLVIQNVRQFIGCHMVVHVSTVGLVHDKKNDDVTYNPTLIEMQIPKIKLSYFPGMQYSSEVV